METANQTETSSKAVVAAETAVALAQETAALAEIQAAQTVAEVRDEINSLTNESLEQEENIEWLRNQVRELRAMTVRQQDELLTLKDSLAEASAALQTAEAAAVAAAMAAVAEMDRSNLSATTPVISSETPMERPESDAAESPAPAEPEAEARAKSHKRNRILV